MAASLEELMAQYKAQQKQASTLAADIGSASSAGLAAVGGVTGLVGAVAAPIAARYIGDAFGLNERSEAEKRALSRIGNVAEGGRTAAQAALEYQRGRVGQQAAQAAAMGPARERAARQLVGQEQRISAESQLSGQAAQVKAQEQARAQQFLADVESRAGEAERQRQRQMVAGAVTGGINALATTYASYQADKKRAEDLKAQAAGAQAAIDMIKSAQDKGAQPSVAQKVAEPITKAGQAFFDERKIDSMTPDEAFAAAENQDPNMPMGSVITGGGLAPQSGTFAYDPLNEQGQYGQVIGAGARPMALVRARKTRGPNVTRFERGSY